MSHNPPVEGLIPANQNWRGFSCAYCTVKVAVLLDEVCCVPPGGV
jgi:hypothetical protein